MLTCGGTARRWVVNTHFCVYGLKTGIIGVGGGKDIQTALLFGSKDVLAVGASIQNMLLTIHSMGLGGVWLGEILKNKERVGELLGAEAGLELMAVIALGYPDGKTSRSEREPVCGIVTTLFILSNGLSGSIGSFSKTSSRAGNPLLLKDFDSHLLGRGWNEWHFFSFNQFDGSSRTVLRALGHLCIGGKQ
jgi:hypothetical protein